MKASEPARVVDFREFRRRRDEAIRCSHAGALNRQPRSQPPAAVQSPDVHWGIETFWSSLTKYVPDIEAVQLRLRLIDPTPSSEPHFEHDFDEELGRYFYGDEGLGS